MNTYRYQPVFELTRGDLVESVHYGAIAVADAQGNLLASYANPKTVVFLRSAAKPFQLLSFLEHGGQEFYGFNLEEISVMCASHAGTDAHVNVLRSIHRKVNIEEAQLQCGVHPLSDEETVVAIQARQEAISPIRHNCSGKHTGMLAYAQMIEAPLENYLALQHPVQKAILSVFSQICNIPAESVVIGTDGCSAPNFAVPLENVAAAFARLCDPQSSNPQLPLACIRACQTVSKAMQTYPDMVAGPKRFDTQLMRTANTSGSVLISKGGAEGYQAIGLFPGSLGLGSPGIGIAFKISDGDLKGHGHPNGEPYGHAKPAVAIEILRQLGLTLKEESLLDYGPGFQIRNWRNLPVGNGRTCFKLSIRATVEATLTKGDFHG
jgi:L-asparaginase II